MPTQKDLKRLVRRRMQKTGESYTSARAQLLKSRSEAPARKPSPAPDAYARLAGMSDAAVKAATGCTWKRWVDALDYVGAHAWPHRRIAEYVRTRFKVRDWWCQTVTVGYERIRGLRAIGQRRDGSYEANKSRTFAVPVERLFAAFAEDGVRERWLPTVTLRKATPHKWARLTAADGSPVGLGRSLFAFVDRAQVSHAFIHRHDPPLDCVTGLLDIHHPLLFADWQPIPGSPCHCSSLAHAIAPVNLRVAPRPRLPGPPGRRSTRGTPRRSGCGSRGYRGTVGCAAGAGPRRGRSNR